MNPTDHNETAPRTILVVEHQSELRGLVTATLEADPTGSGADPTRSGR